MNLEKLVNESQTVAKEWGIKIEINYHSDGQVVVIKSLDGRKFVSYELDDGRLWVDGVHVIGDWLLTIENRIELEAVIRKASRIHKEINQKREQEIKEKNTKPSVDWQDPGVAPDVPVGEYKEFWVAHSAKDAPGDERVEVLIYVNCPLQYADDDIDQEEPISDYCIDGSGEPVSIVGWHDMLNNEYGEYQFLPISDDSKIIAWAEYVAPDFPNT